MAMLSLTAPQSLRAGADRFGLSGRSSAGLRPQGDDDPGLPPPNPRLTSACGVRLAAAITACALGKGRGRCSKLIEDASGDCAQAAYDYLDRMNRPPPRPGDRG